ncbi:hypothetical protein PHAVU_009G152600 [Phaseolus vulgaris]|uniref:Uncharacterized protein n=1 Tax=Phaseolus vulgaris TaxID=3885 RepID=V7AZU0_PHAVU|nr:hypothetical protein PHAVU_009G152600g [Phaseolus vulgaris]XP_007137748.1 hypothetical protein PHAVU_009G152600g [Phaseolus vulgaris]ESW09741.1 hypothetical protein PHAVU_009G152600g [Phaseolus vulgaris]ESW09742.1 hypothetical protein PHAVU_009G152600g [Phaseolus vulgaris]
MLPLKLVRSLVLGETINHNPHHMLTQNHHTHDDDDDDSDVVDDDDEAHGTSQPHHHTRRRRRRRYKIPGLIFLPTKEIIRDTYRLATIARDLGLDLYPTPSLSHIIFSNPSSSSKPSSLTFSSSSCSLQSNAVPIPFPSLSATPLTHLRCFLTLSPRAFKIVLFSSGHHTDAAAGAVNAGNWDCGSFSLYSRFLGHRVGTMEEFCRILAGKGWSFYKTKKNPSSDQRRGGAFYLFRRVDVNRVRVGAQVDGACRVRELRLPHLDFGNAPLRILQYILVMTDDIFCLA